MACLTLVHLAHWLKIKRIELFVLKAVKMVSFLKMEDGDSYSEAVLHENSADLSWSEVCVSLSSLS